MSVATLSRTSEGLRDVYGRGMNVHSDVYKLPADTEEHDRLTMQHRIWKLMLGGINGLYPPEVSSMIECLLSSNGSQSGDIAPSPTVLDLGSGSGIWSAEMAAMYPHAKIVGLDLTEPKLQGLFPSNCSFVTRDLTEGLDGYRESFDIVHCRCVAGHVVDRLQLMREIAKVLKPGGLLLIGDGNLDLYKMDGTLVPAIAGDLSLLLSQDDDIQGSWLARWFNEVIGRLLSATLDPEHAGGKHLEWLVRQEPALEYIEARAYFSPMHFHIPSGSGEISEQGHAERDEVNREREGLASLAARNICNYLSASKHILLSAGVSEEIVDSWSARARKEILQPLPEETWSMKWDMVWARKISIDASA